jgi:GNAT superfamily N-acetyltransferase
MTSADDSQRILIRDATPGDADVIAEFNQRMALETEHRSLEMTVLRRGVDRALRPGADARYFVAVAGGELVGQTMITHELSDWRDGVFWWIQSVYVRADRRGRGVFRALYAHVESLARATPGVCGIRLYVERENRAAMATYERLGMRPSGHVVYEVDWSAAGGPPR